MNEITSPLGQIKNLIDQAKKILIAVHRRPDGDAVGSSLALSIALQKMGKIVTVVSSDIVPEQLLFLPRVDQVEDKFSAGRDIILRLDCAHGEVGKLKYSIVDGKMNIVISPKKGGFAKEDVAIDFGETEYDLCIILDTGDLSQLGKIYEDNIEFFQSLPIINIDHHASNVQFGTINYTDPIASSTCEILPRVIKAISPDEELMDPDMATLLLAGIITDTGSFQNPNTSPNSFEISAELLEAGGRQQEIIRRVYKTKQLTTLKLWGKILSKIQYDQEYKIVWSNISRQDLIESGADAEESGGIIDELMTNAPDSEIIVLLKEYEDVISVSIRTTNATVDATKIARRFGGGGHVQAAGFKMPNENLYEAERKVIEAVKEFQSERLGLGNKNSVEKPAEPKPEIIEKEIIIKNPNEEKVAETEEKK